MSAVSERPIRIVTLDDLKSLKGVSYSRSWLWKLEQRGQWPKRVRLSPKRYGWVEAEIDEHLQKLAAARGIAA
jgi:predicted DNA-binding transcriptional regulator AlpA